MKKICELLGEELTPAELEEKVLSGSKNKYRDAWMKVNGDALKDYAKLIRDTINEVNPNIRASAAVNIGHSYFQKTFTLN